MVNASGASAGCILRGSGLNNQGLRLRVLQEQPRGHDGGIQGNFVILDVGNNLHSPALKALLQKVTDAEEVLEIIRQRHASCVNIANTNILALEQD
ncbi:MAG TPA: hypothetical protein VG013_34075 [Gemmataceae bacterium]|nr:hypothetical protein [Gemmataceae bacterium]